MDDNHFLFSNQVADDSNTMSSGIAEVVYKLIQKIYVNDISSYDKMNHFVRKLVHFSNYLILGFLVNRGLNKNVSLSSFIKAFFICFIYEYSDEFYQDFIPGRAMMFSDVVIDSIGSIMSILAFYLQSSIAKL